MKFIIPSITTGSLQKASVLRVRQPVAPVYGGFRPFVVNRLGVEVVFRLLGTVEFQMDVARSIRRGTSR